MEAVKGVYVVPDGSQLNGLNWKEFSYLLAVIIFHCYQIPTTYSFCKEDLKKAKN